MALRGVKQQIASDAEDLAGMDTGLSGCIQIGHHLACDPVGADDPAVGVQREQAVGVAAQGITWPVQAQQQAVFQFAQQSVFNSLG